MQISESQSTAPQTKPFKPWYVASGIPYDCADPCFFDAQEFPWVAPLEAEWMTIRDELDQLLRTKGDSLTPYFNPDLVSGTGVWKVFPFFFWKLKFWNNCRICPQTTKLLESIPNMVGASFSMLEPHSVIKPHNGDTNAIIRCHLGLLIPAQLPDCGMGVGDESQSWSEGKLMMFCDAHRHTAWNHSDYRRFVLILDVIRPEYASMTNWVCFKVLAAIARQWIDSKVNGLKRRLGMV